MTYRSGYYEAAPHARWVIGKIVLWLVGLSLVFGLVGRCAGWFGEAADVAREQFGPRGGLAKYEWFRDKHESIGAVRLKARAADADVVAFNESAGPRDKWTFEDKQEAARLSAVARATRNILAEMVAEYNANSRKFNHAQFRAADLPFIQEE